ncbi:MAG: metal-dependent hydrolase [Bryobacteraceae bacterium]
MENVTHTIVGLMMARAGLEKTTARGAGMMMIAANLPDIDAYYWFTDRLRYLDHHRAFTHSLGFAPLMALVPMLLVKAKFSWRVYFACLAGVLSHLLLDWTNPYGIQLLLPLSPRRVMLDITNIADLWIWVILFLGLLAPLLFLRKRSAEGGESSRRFREGFAWFALIALFTYECGRFLAHDHAVAALAAQQYRGPDGKLSPPREVIAVPADFVHPMRWRGIVRGADYAAIVPVTLGEAVQSYQARVYPEAPPGPAIEAAKQRSDFQVMMRFSRAPFWVVRPVPGGNEVMFVDLRFGTPEGAGFATVSALIPDAAN